MSEEKTDVVVQPGGVAGAITAGGSFITQTAKLTSQQVITVFAMISMVVINGIVVWLLFETKNDRRDERRDAADRSAALLRSFEDARERDRQFQDNQLDKARTLAVARDKALMEHCSEEARKQRESDEMSRREMNKVISTLTTEIGRLVKKGPDEQQEQGIAVAPMPKSKPISP